MPNSRKFGPVRQLSVHCDPAYDRPKSLRKQLSEQGSPSRSKWTSDQGVPQRKMAWEEVAQNEEGIIAKKCKEVRRPSAVKVTKQNSSNKDSILFSHHDLANRLKKVWDDRDRGKQNLNIFLARDKQDEDLNDLTDNEVLSTINFENHRNRPKSLTPISQEMISKESEYKSIFQKRIRRSASVETAFDSERQILYSPARSEVGSKTVLIVPLDNKPKSASEANAEKEKAEDLVLEEWEGNTEEARQNKAVKARPKSSNVPKPIDVVIRPRTSCSTKREKFQSRANSAFVSSTSSPSPSSVSFRPPLIRASSLPAKPGGGKQKFVATKRRIKSSKCRGKNEKLTTRSFFWEENEKSKRCFSVSSGGEVVTMVSLVSPASSDVEEVGEKEKEKSRASSPEKVVVAKKIEKADQPAGTFCLRKTVKSGKHSLHT